MNSSPIVKDFEYIVGSMRDATSNLPLVPYYEYGHRLEIANLLTKKQGSQYKFNRYPLIALRLDFSEEMSLGLTKVKLNIAILTKTEEGYSSKQRYDNVFIPVLYPLYDRFIEAIRTSGIYFWKGNLKIPPHTKIDRPYWGTQFSEGNVKNIFNDPIDAIELIDLQLTKKTGACLPGKFRTVTQVFTNVFDKTFK